MWPIHDYPPCRSIRRRSVETSHRKSGLFPETVADISIHVEATQGPLNRIDHSVMILVEFLKVVVLQLTRLGIWRSPCSAIPAWVVAPRYSRIL